MTEDEKNQIELVENIEFIVYNIRGVQVMLDTDLARIYGYEVKRLNEQVKRNIERFPDDFMFQLTKAETEDLRSQVATANLNSCGASSKDAGKSMCAINEISDVKLYYPVIDKLILEPDITL